MTQFKKGSVIYLQKPVLIYLGIFMAVSNFSIFAAQAMYLPFAMENLNGDAWTYGIFAASWPVGYIIGALILGRLPDFELSARIKIMIAALVLGTLTFILLAFSGNIYTAVVVEIAAGISGPFWNVYSTHLYQLTVPEDIRAQVFSFRILIARVFAPVGILFGTFVSAAFGIEIMLMIVGALSCTVILLVYFIFMRGRKEKLLGRSSIGS
jgi:predicted MFS family arabinose efflux permease